MTLFGKPEPKDIAILRAHAAGEHGTPAADCRACARRFNSPTITAVVQDEYQHPLPRRPMSDHGDSFSGAEDL